MQNQNQKKTNDGADHRKNGGTKVLSRTTIASLGKSRPNMKLDCAKDKELINNGLQKLFMTLTPPNKMSGKTSNATVTKQESQGATNSHIVLSKGASIDKYTMTDFVEEERQLDMDSTVLNDEQPYRDLQWTDPRLLKKYSIMKQTHNKKSLTIPCVKSECGDDSIDTSEADADLLYPENQPVLFKYLYYFCTASVFFIGCMCGITLITVILWKMLDENLLTFYLTSPRNNFVVRGLVKNLGLSIFSMFGNFFGKMWRLFTISTSEAFSENSIAQAAPRWYHRIYH